MNEVVAECNQEFANKIQDIQNSNAHDEYVLDGNMASWKDILLVYTIKQSNGKNETDVVTIDENKKKVIKEIFWEMNTISSEVKEETVKQQDINTDGEEQELTKKVLHIKITTKCVDEMKSKYNFNSEQNKQLAELSSDKYASLWAGVIYGSNGSGEYVNWRQTDPSWANIRMGNSSGTIGRIGCLVTSISILIEKSGVNTTISPFNPGTFVEALNKNGGFDGSGNLQYAAVSKAVPGFKYVGNVNLRGKTRQEKLSIISEYFGKGYYLTAEVKGATKGSQHWVAITGVDSVNVMMVDPASNQTILWNAYEVNKTTQFNYFTVE